ncbi:MAG: SsrA-binding protein SmpB [Candidatus Poribacteria bacterium]|nr:SsrA-binding protein SmpB [Candidatus Poribacteria bacterium]
MRGRRNAKGGGGVKVVAVNRKARYEYHLSDRFEAGIALLGSEVKSIREGKVNLTDSYALIRNGQADLMKMHVSPYGAATHINHEPERPRRLLLHKREIAKLSRETTLKGRTIVPTRVYFKRGLVKVEIALASGKAQYDKREAIKRRMEDRAMNEELKRYDP